MIVVVFAVFADSVVHFADIFDSSVGNVAGSFGMDLYSDCYSFYYCFDKD